MSWKGSVRVCETAGVLEEEEENVLDPSLTCVPLDVMSLSGSVSPTVKWECVLNGQQDSICTVSLGH